MATRRDIGGSLLKGLAAAGSTFAAGKVRQVGERQRVEAKEAEIERKAEIKRLEDEEATKQVVGILNSLGLKMLADEAGRLGLTKLPPESVLKRSEQAQINEQDQFEQALKELLPPGQFGDIDPTGIAAQAGISPGGLETKKGRVDASGLLMDLAPGLPTNVGQPRQNLFDIAVGTDPDFMADLQRKAAKVRFSRETLKAKSKGQLAAITETAKKAALPVSREKPEKETAIKSKYQTYLNQVKGRNRTAKKESKKAFAEYKRQLFVHGKLSKEEKIKDINKFGLLVKPEKFKTERPLSFIDWESQRQRTTDPKFLGTQGPSEAPLTREEKTELRRLRVRKRKQR